MRAGRGVERDFLEFLVDAPNAYDVRRDLDWEICFWANRWLDGFKRTETVEASGIAKQYIFLDVRHLTELCDGVYAWATREASHLAETDYALSDVKNLYESMVATIGAECERIMMRTLDRLSQRGFGPP